MTESMDAQFSDAVQETANEIIDMVVERYRQSDEHNPARMTSAALLVLKRMLGAYGDATLTLVCALDLQAQGIAQLADDECEDCEEEGAADE